MKYYISKTVDMMFDDAVVKVTEELKREGFGILTDIDVKETFRKKLNVDFRKYRILGACNPPYAYKALQAEDKIGVMLPCNFILQELPDKKTEVSAIDPEAMASAAENPEMKSIASEVKAIMKKVIDRL